MRSWSSYPTLLALCVVAGCGGPPVKIEVSQHIEVDCGQEPTIDRLVLLPHDPIGYKDENGIPWVKFSVRHYEHMSENAARTESRFDQDAAVIIHYRDCIEDFNGSSEDATLSDPNSGG